VVAEGRHPGAEREFGTTLSCEPHKCRAPWIEPDTRYTFQHLPVIRLFARRSRPSAVDSRGHRYEIAPLPLRWYA
jgi:hypothetical protein